MASPRRKSRRRSPRRSPRSRSPEYPSPTNSPRSLSPRSRSPTTRDSGRRSPRDSGSRSPRDSGRRSLRDSGSSSPRESGRTSPRDVTIAEDDSNSDTFENDYASETNSEKVPQSLAHLLKAAYQSLGVIYGDMGTSPLYVFSSTFVDPPTDIRDVVGALSLIFWTVTMIGVVKYVSIVLNADDNGEGGTSSLYTLLCRHVKISLLISQHESDTGLKNYKRIQSQANIKQKIFVARCKAALESSPVIHKVLLLLVMAGSCMVIGDGILTPAISVLSAIEGIQVVATQLKTSIVLVITCLILIALFTLQRYGTSKVSFLFAPVIVLWLGLIAGIGIFNIATYRPSIFRACSPHYGILFLVRNKMKGWIMLGGVVLSITGTEAMFADLGHFNARSIQIAFAGVVYPCLTLAYFGQAAYLTVHPENVSHAFFKSTPRPVFWPMLVVATLSTIVASQAMISGSFSVINQALNLGCFPRVKVIHTSKTHRGQIYIPEINFALMIAAIAIVLGFKNTGAIGNAYGIAVVSVMFITTCLTTLVIIVVWEYQLAIAILFFCVFGSIEGLYLSSVLYKVAFGGWVPLVIAAAILFIMCVWQYGTLAKHKFDLEHMVSMDQLDEVIADSITETRVTRVPGIGLFYATSDKGIPPIFSHFINNLPALHQIMVFVCIKYVPVTTVLLEERVFLRKLTVKNFYQAVIRYGYNEVPMAGKDFDDLIVNTIADKIKTGRIKKIKRNRRSRKTPSPKSPRMPTSSGTDSPDLSRSPQRSPRTQDVTTTSHSQAHHMEEVAYLLDAKENGVVYVMSRLDIQAKAGSTWYRRFLINIAYNVLCNYCRSDVTLLNIPTQRLIEVGMVYNL